MHTHKKNPMSGLKDELYFHNITAFYSSKLLRINLEEQSLHTLTKTKNQSTNKQKNLFRKAKMSLETKKGFWRGKTIMYVSRNRGSLPISPQI